MPAFSPCRILRAASQKNPDIADKIRALAQTSTNWGSTLALPKSKFPPRPIPEQIDTYRRRCADELYAWQRKNRKPTRHRDEGEEVIGNEFVLHDGPPYANGAVHVGHALNKVLKDLILRWELARGKRVRYVPGWDCHGLPIELKALQLKEPEDAPKQHLGNETGQAGNRLNALTIREKASRLAAGTVDSQKKSFREWGVMGEWDHPYKTMDQDFEVRQLRVFQEMVRKGLISRHHQPVYWSPSSRTALAEAELEYDDIHKCTAAFVKMPFVQLPKTLKASDKVKPDNIHALIWTTTPWTLPANKAIAVNANIEYAVIEIEENDAEPSPDQLLVARDRIDHVLGFLPEGATRKYVIESIPGSQLADGNATCLNPISNNESPLLDADFVTATSGTGLVHMAPEHGMEDFQVCRRNGIGTAPAPVDDEGRFTSEACPHSHRGLHLEGLDAQTDGVQAILKFLSQPRVVEGKGSNLGPGQLLAAHKFTHKNPIDWRTKQPVIVRATAQWFADVSAIKDRALTALDDVHFIPEGGKSRLTAFIEGRSHWCISRQRAWGVPIPALYHIETGEACVTDESINHIIAFIQREGTAAWFSDVSEESAWLHTSLESGKWARGKDTMDVWFDSGTTWTSLDSSTYTDTKRSHLSDVYLEGTDQHRGWFQSSLLTFLATQDWNSKPVAPFKTLITHGFTLDSEGRKMSKSIGNVVSPEEILAGSLLISTKEKQSKATQKKAQPTRKKEREQTPMGPDLLRLWVASSDYTRDVSISQPVLQSIQQALQKYRVTFKFLLGVLYDHDVSGPELHHIGRLNFADTAVLFQLSKCSQKVFDAYSDYSFHAGISEINKFVNNDLSAFYFEIIKDTLYAGAAADRKHAQTILMIILKELWHMLGPVTPHLIEEVWEFFPDQFKERDITDGSPLQRIWDCPFDPSNPALARLKYQPISEEALDVFRKISSAAKIAQEAARSEKLLRSGLACQVQVHLPPDSGISQEAIPWLFDNQELASLLVVSQARVVTTTSDGATPKADWTFQETFEIEWNGKKVTGEVTVLPPQGQKCVRCWKYTAEEPELPCGQCQTVLAESM